ncbi:MAG: hypothetical protein PHI99_00065 [Syntrophales bacterium]|nr:hypothetical protein [Syntrophales bacterium]
MIEKPRSASDYSPEYVRYIKQTLLYMAAVLEEHLDDFVVVGGLVPSLLIPPVNSPERESHVGTMDLDIGFNVAVLNEQAFDRIKSKLRESGFERDTDDKGLPRNDRWVDRSSGNRIVVDFLVPPKDEYDGNVRNLSSELDAIVVSGLHLAFEDRVRINIVEPMSKGGLADRQVWVCGPGAFVILKALVFGLRDAPKDAYDLYFVIRNFGAGVRDIYEHLCPLMRDPKAKTAIDILRNHFSEPGFRGPVMVSHFLFRELVPEVQADVAGFVRELLSLCDKGREPT